MSNAWIEFWDRPNRIYANERHLAAHCRIVADALLSVLPDRPGLTVLDFGCGEALDAARVAARVGRLVLYDAAPSVRARLATRNAGQPRIEIVDSAGLAVLPDGSLDVVFASSVVQYLDADGLSTLLRAAHRLLAPGGILVVADVIAPETGLAADVRALLALGLRNGFFWAAVLALGATLLSDYRRLRSHVGLSLYDDATFSDRLAEAGFAAERLPRNLGENPARRSYRARKAA